jgi:HSP20 family protein
MTQTLMPWDVRTPRLFDNFRREMDHLMEQFFKVEDGGQQLVEFSPRVNVAETPEQYEITVDLPGMKPEEFNIELKENQLWITGERKVEREEKGRTWHRVERSMGQFRRIIPLETPVTAEGVEAEYKDGVLRLSVQKDKSVQPKRIPVKS